MANKSKLDKVWTYICSSSIANWQDKLDKRLGLKRKFSLYGPVIFIGLYHWVDYLRYAIHKGRKKVFWCGSDILALEKSWWRFIIPGYEAEHFCENNVEQYKLAQLKINSHVCPMIFDDPEKYHPSLERSDRPNVWVCIPEHREEEYGLKIIEDIAGMIEVDFHIFGVLKYQIYTKMGNIFYHGRISEEQLNEHIKYYQCGLRLNEFDGFSEVTAKSILLGQYPMTRIAYSGIDCYNTKGELINLLKDLKNKKAANPVSQEWRERLNQSKNVLLHDEQYQI